MPVTPGFPSPLNAPAQPQGGGQPGQPGAAPPPPSPFGARPQQPGAQIGSLLGQGAGLGQAFGQGAGLPPAGPQSPQEGLSPFDARPAPQGAPAPAQEALRAAILNALSGGQ